MSPSSLVENALAPGVRWDGRGIHAVLPSRQATAVTLCLFASPESQHEERRLPLSRRDGDLWHAYVPNIAPGQLYGYRVDGPWAPGAGYRFNPNKLLVDPYALAISGEPRCCASVFPPLPADPDAEPPFDAPFDDADSAPAMPRCVVVDPAFDWQDDGPPRTPWRDTVIYECHVGALTATHPEVPPTQRGTYLGLASPPIIAHLQSLGVTAVELLPIHQIASERHLLATGRRNVWGYSTLGYFAPHAGYASAGLGAQVREWKTMVRTLHRAGIEVILDVVYNHTAEGDHNGPTLSFKGIDNARFYRLEPEDASRYEDITGCGNTLDIRRSPVRQLIRSSLRYWVEAMHVDGFRFDLASTLARHEEGDDEAACFLDELRQDPVLGAVKLIAEPWDLGAGGYRLGRFPTPWAEWNDHYRDDVRRFWRAEPVAARLATRLAGSSDLFAPADKPPTRSLNFITCHDGFPLADLVAYEQKHNEANGEANRDGSRHNLSRNWGVEGPTDDPAIRRQRARRRRSLLATLAFSRGVPMLLYGDEVGRTQGGNNNAYCQDNATTWVDWALDGERRACLAFTRRVLALRRRFPVFRRAVFFRPATPPPGAHLGIDDARWLDPEGHPLAGERWQQAPAASAFALRLASPDLSRPDDPPRSLLLLFNGSENPIPFHLPADHTWQRLLDTASPETPDPTALPTAPLTLAAGTLQLLASVEAISAPHWGAIPTAEMAPQ